MDVKKRIEGYKLLSKIVKNGLFRTRQKTL